MRWTMSTLGAVLILSVAGCGSDGDSDTSSEPQSQGTATATSTSDAEPSEQAPEDVEFPEGKVNEAGNYYVPTPDETTAERLCDAAQERWPDVYAEYDQVTFDLPGTGSDYTCVKVG